MTTKAPQNESGEPAKLFLCEWIDASGGTDHWMGMDEIIDNEGYTVHSVGWVVRANPKFTTLIPHWYDHEDGIHTSGHLSIPTACIVSMVEINNGP